MIGDRQTLRSQRVLLVAIVILLMVALAACELPRPGRRPTPVVTPSPPPGALQFPSEPARVTSGQPSVVPGQIILKLNPEPALQALRAAPEADGTIATGLPDIDSLNRQFGVKTLDPLIKPLAQASGETVQSFVAQQPELLGLYVASFDPQHDPNTVASAYQAEASVIYAEPNYYAYTSDEPLAPTALTPNDPYFGFQWNMPLIQAPQAWDVSTGQGVLVAVLDTGIAYETFDSYQQAPDLGNTQFTPGYDFINSDGHANDDMGHGTHVAGTIAQSTNNGQGVSGVAFGATLMPVKVLDDRGQGSYDAIAQGIIYAADRGARVINMSLSGRGGSSALAEAVDYAVRKGALIVAAAGNSGGAVEYPAAYGTVLAVGSVGFNRVRVDYSNFGSQIELMAPGGDTDVDLNGDSYPDGILQQAFRGGNVTNFGFYYFEGTSMAAPHVSGVAALLFARNPAATASQVRQTLQSTAFDLGPAGRDNEYGYGLVQAANALAAIGGPPQATPTPTPGPSTPTATPSPSVQPPGGTPTPTPSPSAQPPGGTPTPTPAPVSGNFIVNGDFETDAGWILSLTHQPASYTTDLAHSGARSARLGIVEGVDRFSYSSVWQPVTIPADARLVTLTCWVYPISEDTFPRDLQLVLVLNERFRVISYTDRSLSNERQWIQRSYDLTSFAGRTVTIYFGVFNRGGTGKPSGMYVDDVVLTVER